MPKTDFPRVEVQKVERFCWECPACGHCNDEDSRPNCGEILVCEECPAKAQVEKVPGFM